MSSSCCAVLTKAHTLRIGGEQLKAIPSKRRSARATVRHWVRRADCVEIRERLPCAGRIRERDYRCRSLGSAEKQQEMWEEGKDNALKEVIETEGRAEHADPP